MGTPATPPVAAPAMFDKSGTTLRGLGWSAASDANANWASRQGPLQLKSTRADRGFLVALERRTPRSVTAATFRIGGSTTRYQVDTVAGSAGRFPETRTPVATAPQSAPRPQPNPHD